MKKIEWKIFINDKNQIGTSEHTEGINMDKMEDVFMMIGVLESLKQSHLSRLSTLFEKTTKRDENNKSDKGWW